MLAIACVLGPFADRSTSVMFVAMFARIGTDVAFYTFTLYILTFITTNLGLPRQVGLNAVLVLKDRAT